MKLSDKIVALRKSAGMSQEELAEKLNVSRQAVSRWETGTAMPDAANLLQLSRLFQVSADYILNDELERDSVRIKTRESNADGLRLLLIFMITLEAMILVIQFMAAIILQNVFFSVLSFLPFIAVIGGFEYGFHRKAGFSQTDEAFPQKQEKLEQALLFRKRFYQISSWLGTYFPIRFAVTALMVLYPRPYYPLVLECVIVIIYIMAAALLSLGIERRSLCRRQNAGS